MTWWLPLASTFAAEPTPIPGTDVALVVPRGFVVVTDRFAGIEDAATNARVVVFPLGSGEASVPSGRASERRYDEAGLRVVKTTPTTLSGRPAEWTQLVGTLDPTVRGWAVRADGAEGSVLLVASCAPCEPPLVAVTLEAVLKEARWTPGSAAAAAPATFAIDAPAGMVASPGGPPSVQAFGEPGAARAPGVTTFVAAPSMRAVAPTSEVALATLSGVATVADLAVTSHEPIAQAGLRGWESTATGRHDLLGDPRVVYQILLFRPDGTYLRAVGIGPAGGEIDWLARFRAAGRTLRPAG